MTGPVRAAVASLTLGGCDDVRAEVLVQARHRPDGAEATITGTLTGPHRGRDTTLPATARLQPTATAGLARAILTEPAYWTPDLPNRYRLEATITSAGGSPVIADQLVGLRRLGVRGRSLWLDGRRWVPRAVRIDDVAGIDACKPAALAAVVTEPDEATLDHADEIGVAVLAMVSDSVTNATAVADRITTWSAHPSAAVAILPDDVPAATVAEVAAAVRGRRDTLLLAATVAAATPPPTAAPAGIDVLMVALETDVDPHDGWRAGAGLPLIAWRRQPAAPMTGRRPCDELQAVLAAWGSTGDRHVRPWDWAGYVVA